MTKPYQEQPSFFSEVEGQPLIGLKIFVAYELDSIIMCTLAANLQQWLHSQGALVADIPGLAERFPNSNQTVALADALDEANCIMILVLPNEAHKMPSVGLRNILSYAWFYARYGRRAYFPIFVRLFNQSTFPDYARLDTNHTAEINPQLASADQHTILEQLVAIKTRLQTSGSQPFFIDNDYNR